ncbi:hypothetical protein PISMIDRAFT_347464 [Pisolithus microcarpus 441]|uniref:Uncharacterized protein n=1 Tax=Pisolithus microcarpus 441 TaxID=765257 RepID=A0A0C9YL87_9AGAM|nr:hypothetical protein PISMIDRAFT_347464 [Pisolithus microcarpus 441]
MTESFKKCALETIEGQSWVQQGDGYGHSRIPPFHDNELLHCEASGSENSGTTRIGLISCPVNVPRMNQKGFLKERQGCRSAC